MLGRWHDANRTGGSAHGPWLEVRLLDQLTHFLSGLVKKRGKFLSCIKPVFPKRMKSSKSASESSEVSSSLGPNTTVALKDHITRSGWKQQLRCAETFLTASAFYMLCCLEPLPTRPPGIPSGQGLFRGTEALRKAPDVSFQQRACSKLFGYVLENTQIARFPCGSTLQKGIRNFRKHHPSRHISIYQATG